MRIICTKNQGYAWTESENVYFRGYIQTQGKLAPLRGLSAIAYFAQAGNYNEFIELLKNVDGIFSVIVDRNKYVWAAVDIARSMPLYYSKDNSIVSDSAESIRVSLGIQKEAFDPYALEEMLITSCIGFGRTAYAEIAQLDVGQAIEFRHDGTQKTYYYLHYKNKIDVDRKTAMEMFQRVADESIEEIVATIAGRPVVLSLSGGYDSRYVACMLKSHGVEDVSCYTYGRPDSFEIQRSQSVAQALGYRWQCVVHTDERVKSILDDENMPYFDMNTGHDSHTYFQNFIAVKYLHETGWFKKGSVFLTGLCNDMPTGFYVKTEESIANCMPTKEFLAKYFANATGGNMMHAGARRAYISEICNTLEEMDVAIENYEEFVGAYDALLTAREHSRRILHMNDVPAYFGYECLLPCWNKNSLDFWYSMPLEYRLGQNLYEEWITTALPVRYGISERKEIVSYTSYRGWSRFVARIVLISNRALLLPLGITLKQETDINNFSPIVKELFRGIHQKFLIGFRRTNANYIWTLYLKEQWYGADFYRAIRVVNRESIS